MAEIPIYRPQVTLPSRSGAAPIPDSIADQSGLIKLGQTITSGMSQAAYYAAYIDAQQKQAELKTTADGILFAGREKLSALQNKYNDMTVLQRPDGSETTNPREFRDAFDQEASALYQQTIEEAGKQDERIGQYVAPHFDADIKAAGSTMRNAMNKRWTEWHQFQVMGQIDQLKRDAIEAPPILDGTARGHSAIMATLRQKIGENVGLAYTAEQANTLMKQYEGDIRYARVVNRAKQSQSEDINRWLDRRAVGLTPDYAKGLSEDELQKVDEEVRKAFTYREQVQTKNEKKAQVEQEAVFGKQRMDLETGIIQGAITESELPNFQSKLKPDDYHTLITLAHARELEEIKGENVKTDPLVASGLLSRLTSPKMSTVEGVSEDEITQAIKDKKLDWSTASSIIKYRRERLDHFRNEAESLYDKTAQEGETLISTLFRTTGLLDIDKQMNQAMADALFEYRSRWRERRGSHVGEDPLSWVYEIVQRHEAPILDRNLSETSKRIQGLKPELQTPEKAAKAFHDRKITEAEYKQALALHARMEETARIQDMFKNTGKGGKVQDR